MNRREFLKTLVALGMGNALPAFSIQAATEADIDKTWTRLEEFPIEFEVAEFGALSWNGMAYPGCRADCLGLELSDNPTVAEVMALAAEDWRAKRTIAQAYLDRYNRKDDPDYVKDNVLRNWLNAGDENVHFVGARLRDWLADMDLSEFDYETAGNRGNTPQGAALRFWRDGAWDPQEFGIVIIEGDHPGSTYFAAELRQPIELANGAAKTLGVPIRFI